MRIYAHEIYFSLIFISKSFNSLFLQECELPKYANLQFADAMKIMVIDAAAYAAIDILVCMAHVLSNGPLLSPDIVKFESLSNMTYFAKSCLKWLKNMSTLYLLSHCAIPL